jgi:GNAT superfamily N-acetyltransferase
LNLRVRTTQVDPLRTPEPERTEQLVRIHDTIPLYADNGLAKRARAVEGAPPLPPGIRRVRQATRKDAEAIAAIQERYQLRKLDAADHPQNGWLVQSATPEAIRASMSLYKTFFVAENDEGKIVAYQAVCAPRFISRPANKHKFFGPYAKRALQTLQSGRFIYMSQIAIDPDHRSKGVAAAMQAKVLERYRNYPLVAHVAVFTQDDFDARDPNAPFEPRTNNVASHRYHQKNGYHLVGWTSDLARTVEYNSGLPPPADGELPGVLGALYINFRDGAEDVPHEYVDPVDAVLNAPCAPGEANTAEWENPFAELWPGFDEIDPELALHPERSPEKSPLRSFTEAIIRSELIGLLGPDGHIDL